MWLVRRRVDSSLWKRIRHRFCYVYINNLPENAVRCATRFPGNAISESNAGIVAQQQALAAEPDEMLTAFVELERAIHEFAVSLVL
jgi:hypothetical protein